MREFLGGVFVGVALLLGVELMVLTFSGSDTCVAHGHEGEVVSCRVP